MNNQLESIAKGIIRSNINRRLNVTGSAFDADDTEAERNGILREVSEHIYPKLTLEIRRDELVGYKVKGNIYVFSQSEFEQLVAELVDTVANEMKPKVTWGEEGN